VRHNLAQAAADKQQCTLVGTQLVHAQPCAAYSEGMSPSSHAAGAAQRSRAAAADKEIALQAKKRQKQLARLAKKKHKRGVRARISKVTAPPVEQVKNGVPVAGTGLRLAMCGERNALAARVADGSWCPATVDRYGSTALMWAAGGGHLEVTAWLVDSHRARVDATNKDGAGPTFPPSHHTRRTIGRLNDSVIAAIPASPWLLEPCCHGDCPAHQRERAAGTAQGARRSCGPCVTRTWGWRAGCRSAGRSWAR
jgi:hypothetical protein